MSIFGRAVTLALAMALLSGCAGGRKFGWPWESEPAAKAMTSDATSAATKLASPADIAKTDTGRNSEAIRIGYQADAARPAPPPNGDAAAWDSLMAEVQKVGPLSETERMRLTEDMRRSDPSLWPLIVEAFQTARAYREQQGVHGAPPGPVVTPHVVAAGATAAPKEAPVLSSVESVLTRQSPRVANQFPPGIPMSAAPQTPNPEPAATTNTASTVRITTAPSAAEIAATQPAMSTVPQESAATSPVPGATAAPTTSTTTAAAPVAAVTANAAPIDPLGSAIREWEAKPAAAPGSPEEIQRRQQLRLLYLVAGRRDDALRPIEGAAPADQEFWSAQVYALASYFDTARNSDASRRAAESKLHLEEATTALSQSATLFVRNISFCTEVSSFGVFNRIEKNEFTPQQEALLYAEIENFKSEQTPKGFHTALRSSYKIFDSRGAQVHAHEFPLTEEYCQNRRKDFFIRYFLTIPERMYDGKYTLQLTIEDTIGAKIGQSSIDFFVKAGQQTPVVSSAR